VIVAIKEGKGGKGKTIHAGKETKDLNMQRVLPAVTAPARERTRMERRAGCIAESEISKREGARETNEKRSYGHVLTKPAGGKAMLPDKGDEGKKDGRKN